MKFRFLISLMFLFLFNETFAQNPTLDYRFKEIEIDDNNEYQSILGKWNGNLIAVRSSDLKNLKLTVSTNSIKLANPTLIKNANIILDFFDQNLILKKSIPFSEYSFNSTEPYGKNIEFVKLDSINSKIVFGYSTFEEFNMKFYLSEYDLKTDQFSIGKLVGSFETFDRRGSFHFVESVKGKYFGVYSFLPSPKNDLTSSLITITFDSKFNSVKKNNFVLPFGNNGGSDFLDFPSTKMDTFVKGSNPLLGVRNNSVLLDQSGYFNFVLKVTNLKPNKYDLKPYNFHVIRESDQEGEYISSILGLSDSNSVNHLFLHDNGDGKILCVGTWIDGLLVKGLVVYYLDERNFKDPSYKFIPFNRDLVSLMLIQKHQYLRKFGMYFGNKVPEGVPRLSLDYSSMSEDGAFNLFMSAGTSRIIEDDFLYVGGNIFNLKMKNNEIQSIQVIPRNYLGSSKHQPYGNGYISFNDNSSVFFIDEDSYDFKFSSSQNDLGVVNWNIEILKENKELKKSIIKYYSPFNNSKYYVFLKNKKVSGYKYYLVEIDLPFDKI